MLAIAGEAPWLTISSATTAPIATRRALDRHELIATLGVRSGGS